MRIAVVMVKIIYSPYPAIFPVVRIKNALHFLFLTNQYVFIQQNWKTSVIWNGSVVIKIKNFYMCIIHKHSSINLLFVIFPVFCWRKKRSWLEVLHLLRSA